MSLGRPAQAAAVAPQPTMSPVADLGRRSTGVPDELGYLGLVLRHAESQPAAPALTDPTGTICYGQLRERIGTIAGGLMRAGVAPGDRVALWLPNSSAFVAMTLGCLWLGASWVPIPIDDPPARVQQLLANSAPSLIVVPDGAAAATAAVDRSATATVTYGSLLRDSPQPAPLARDPERDAYIVYTSGTTGLPKGVRVPERAFRWAVLAAAEAFGLGPQSRSLCPSAFHFDGSYGTVFPTLARGGSLVIPKREHLMFPRRFFHILEEEGVTHTACSPSYLNLLLAGWPRSVTAAQFKTLGLGGEECVAGDLARLWDRLPGLRVFNRYGPTETVISATTYEVTAQDVSSGRVPIGRPHEGVVFYLVSGEGRVIDSPEVEGELCIGGEQLMAGYWQDEALTAEVLRTDIVPGERVYRTGDLVYRDQAGRYVYSGRTDDVVKRNGVRISLTEVAGAFRRVAGVSAAACLVRQVAGRPSLTLFAQSAPGSEPAALLDEARAYLPANMLPDQVVLLRSLPMTSAGKVDRAALARALPAST